MHLTILTFTSAALLAASLFTTAARAQPDPPGDPECWPPPCVSTQGCRTIHVRIDGIAEAKGWGGHVSLSPRVDGFGGFFPECHITGGDDPRHQIQLLCYDGFLDPTALQNRFHVPLGPRREVEWVELDLGKKGVDIRFQRHVEHPRSGESVRFEVSSFFPLREATGFCSGDELFYQPNGVLNGRAGRSGSGYTMKVE